MKTIKQQTPKSQKKTLTSWKTTKITINNKKHRSLGKLFYNDKFVMIFSALTALILWVIISTTSQESTVSIITDIPVSFPELSNEMTFFNTDELKAEVRISGNALIVSTVTNKDIYATVSDISHITKPGEYTVNLIPKKGSIKSDFSFDSAVTPSSIKVYVDRQTEREFTITNKVRIQSVAQDRYASPTVLSTQTVTISGAESIVNKIADVAAVYNFTDTLSATTTQKVPITLYDENQKVIQSEYINMSISEVDVTVPILMTKRVPIDIQYLNLPNNVSIDSSWVKVSPSEVYIAAPADIIDSITSIPSTEFNFLELNTRNINFTVGLNLPTGCKNLDNIEQVLISFDMSAMAQKTFTVEKFSVVHHDGNHNATVTTKSLSISIIGPKSEVYSLKPEDLMAVVEMTEKFPLGLSETKVNIALPEKAPNCWTNGEYTVTVNVTENSTNSEAGGE